MIDNLIISLLVITCISCINKNNHVCIDFEKENWRNQLDLREEKNWGESNMSLEKDSIHDGKVLKVFYPKGSASPNVSKVYNAPVGGAEFLAQTGSYDSIYFSYYLKFSPDFDFVKGGKLPGLFGGTANSGGEIPNGYDGFSTRFMWRENGLGELYAYIPKSEQWGTPIANGKFSFKKGQWHKLQHQIVLNEPGTSNGKIKIWLDDTLVHSEKNLVFRSTDSLKINGIFFSTFFGGNDTTWSSSRDNYILFDNLCLSHDYLVKSK